MTMHSALRTMILCVALCPGVPASTAFGSENAVAQSITACSLLSNDEIKKELGARTSPFLDQLPPNEEKLKNGGSECFRANITIQLDAHPVSGFEETRKRYAESGRTTFQSVSGLGDAAYAYDQDPGKSSHVVGVFVKAGQHVLTISMDVNENDSVDALRADVLALAKAAVAKLR
jgi:hypothetical protein